MFIEIFRIYWCCLLMRFLGIMFGFGWVLILLKDVCMGLYLDFNNVFRNRRFDFYCGGGCRNGGGEVRVFFL